MALLPAFASAFRLAFRSPRAQLVLAACFALVTTACGDLVTESTTPANTLLPSSPAAVPGALLALPDSFRVRVKNPAPVVGVLVTATDVGTGAVFYQLTDDKGVAGFALPASRYIVTARRVGSDEPRQLQVWPYTGGEVPAPEADIGAYSGAVYVGGKSVVLTPTNYNAAFLSPLELNPVSLALLQGEITLNLNRAATIQCPLLDAEGHRWEGLEIQLFGSLPHTDTTRLPPVPESYTGNRALPRGLGYGIGEVARDGSCAIPGAPAGTTVLESPPVPTERGPVVFRAAVEVTQAEAASGATVNAIVTPQPAYAFTNYFTGEPWTDSKGAADIGGLITFGWMGAKGNSFGVASGFRGRGIYVLELFTSDPGAHPSSAHAAVRVAILCSTNGCVMLRSAPVPPAGATGTGVRVTVKGVTQGALIWQVPIPGNRSRVWLRIVSPSGSSLRDETVVLKATRQPGSGHSYLIMAGS